MNIHLSRLAVDMTFYIHMHIHIHRFSVDTHIHRCLFCIQKRHVSTEYPQSTVDFFDTDYRNIDIDSIFSK